MMRKVTDKIQMTTTVRNRAQTRPVLGSTELPILYEKCKNKITAKIVDPLENVIECMQNLQNK